jgi:glutamyl-tRNA reductase
MQTNHCDIVQFCVAGINYKKTDAGLRGQFAVSADQYPSILETANSYGIREVFVLSTCNRTEIYGLTHDVQLLINVLCTETSGDADLFNELAYIHCGTAAVQHLFEVAGGLDSQILGDYEIVGQLKQAVKFARSKGCIGSILERMVNAALQASKAIKNQTALSGGTVSVSFAAVQYIKEHSSDIANKRILLLGTGKIGRNTCKNLVDYLGNSNITLINRSPEKAAQLANELGLRHALAEDMKAEVAKADIILVATSSAEPVILSSHLEASGPKLIIDLSIPYNVESAAQELDHITLVNVDDLSRLKDETLQRRRAEVPRAKEIIAEHMGEFAEWHAMRRHIPVLKAVKSTLQQIHLSRTSLVTTSTEVPDFTEDNAELRIQKIITTMAVKMRRQNHCGCQYIEAINEFIATGSN